VKLHEAQQAYAIILAARGGNQEAIAKLKEIIELAERGDERAQYAVGLLDTANEAAKRGIGPSSAPPPPLPPDVFVSSTPPHVPGIHPVGGELYIETEGAVEMGDERYTEEFCYGMDPTDRNG
jgi:hypothetical protein